MSEEAILSFFGHIMAPASKRVKLKGPQDLTDDTAIVPYAATYIGL